MTADPNVFREAQPTAWTFHRGTARWAFSNTTGQSPPPGPGRELPGAPWMPLPVGPRADAKLADVLEARVSCRAFSPEALDLACLASLLRACYGMIGRLGNAEMELVERPNPSAGGLYPLEVSVIVCAVEGLVPGVYHYVPAADGLELIREGPFPSQWLESLFMGQPWVARAACVVVLSAVTGRSLVKYADRGYRYLLLEAGHVSQSLVLTATALDLGAVNIGGFYDDELAGLLRLDNEREVALYATAIGVPAVVDRLGERALPGT